MEMSKGEKVRVLGPKNYFFNNTELEDIKRKTPMWFYLELEDLH